MVAHLDIIGLLTVGFLVEKHFVGRMATFSNAIALNLLCVRISNLHWLLDWYANAGLLLGIAGAISYAASKRGQAWKMPGWYYVLNWFYSSLVVAVIAINPGYINSWLLSVLQIRCLTARDLGVESELSSFLTRADHHSNALHIC